MGQRSHRTPRCPRCRLHAARCICADLPHLELTTRLVLVMHHRERRRSTATGPWALAALPNHRWLLHGVPDQPISLSDEVHPDRRGLILFPSATAQVLSPALLAADPRPVTLVVPDGSWRQASKAARRLPGVGHFEHVVLPEGAPTQYKLRREPKPGGLATMEAIARALGIIEGPEVQAKLEALFVEMVARTLRSRGVSGGQLVNTTSNITI